jgi:siroheme synthase (precorrin-2 oxidase/ferrochelatase)
VVATGRLYYLLEAGAKVTLISPRAGLTEEVRWRIEEEKLVERWEDREWEDKDAEMLRGEFEFGIF